ncbi:MAG: O-antigen ligase family protein [Hydrogenibacillus sp.]|nr:O-antigen ligase family protein [Hydrogenibacillus sp.]
MKRLTIALTALYVLFPLSDFIIRRILGLGGIAGLWDKGLLLLLFLLAWMQADKDRIRQLHPLLTPLGLFAALGVLHLVIDLPNFAAGFDGFRAVFYYALALFVGAWALKGLDDVTRILRIIVAVGIFAAVFGIGQVLLGVETPASWTDAAEKTTRRAFSFVVSPNVLGSYMAFVIPLTAGLGLIARREGKRAAFALYGGAIMLELAALFLSGSRGAWFAFFIAALAVLFIERPRWSALGAVLLGGAMIALPPIKRRLTALFSPTYWEKSATDGRIARWLGSYHQMRFDPLFGRGIGHYGGATGNRFFGTTYVDSYFFKTLAEMGLPGLILFLWLVIAVLQTLFHLWRRRAGNAEGTVSAALFTAVLGVILHNTVENIFEVPFMNAYVWLAVGMAFALTPPGEKPADHPSTATIGSAVDRSFGTVGGENG